jgi:hypothetical protein
MVVRKGRLRDSVAAASIRGPRIWNNVQFRNFPLFGKLSGVACGDFFKVPSEVVVQCFFRWGPFRSPQNLLRDSYSQGVLVLLQNKSAKLQAIRRHLFDNTVTSNIGSRAYFGTRLTTSRETHLQAHEKKIQ